METLIILTSIGLGISTLGLIIFGAMAVLKGLKSTSDELFKILNILGIVVVFFAVAFMFLIALRVFHKV